MRTGTFAAVLGLGLAAAAGAQTPAGAPFRVNTFTPSYQVLGMPAVGPKGDFLIVWSSNNQDGSAFGVIGQRYDALGNRVGGEFLVNTSTNGNQYATSAVADAGGNYIVAWTNDVGNPDPSRDVFARIFDPAGVPRTPEFRVNTFVLGRQSSPALAPLPGGGFVAVWESLNQDGNNFAVVGRRFDSRGNPVSGEFLVNTFTIGEQRAPRVSSDAAGNFAVVWMSGGQDGSGLSIIGRRFDVNGNPQSGEFLVNTTTINDQRYPVVSKVADGRFIVVWEDFVRDGGRYGIFGKSYDAVGNPTSGEFQINVYTTDHQHTPSVVNYGNGSFMAAWYSQDQFGGPNSNNTDVVGRVYRGGVPGPEFLVNPTIALNQFQAQLDADEVGNVVAAWNSVGEDGSLDGIFARRYGGLVPWSIFLDGAPTSTSNGNRVLEAGELVVLDSAWRNVNGATLTFDSTASAFTGPFGPAYMLIDNGASYGSVPNNTVRNCGVTGNCFAMQIAAGPRPAAHWDATFREDISPASLGQSKVWKLHVGDSFSDVPRSSSFYRFVETVYHGDQMFACAPGQFCPTFSVPRDQMAQYVMKSQEPFYVPPACVAGQEMFTDVPASNPFCPYVQELARRGVVAGCGGGAYCPAQGVSREQLPVYLLRTQNPAFTPPACGAPVFNDVPASSPFCPWIEELYRRQVVSGCGGGAYCPTRVVNRAEMSVFLTVTFGLQLYGP
jgi:hypothetical protein